MKDILQKAEDELLLMVEQAITKRKKGRYDDYEHIGATIGAKIKLVFMDIQKEVQNQTGWSDKQMIKAYEDGVSAGGSNQTREYGDGWETSNGKTYLKTKRKVRV